MDGHWGSTTGTDPRAVAAELAGDFATRAERHDREASVARENFAALHQAGLLALTLPVELGGGGGGLREAAAVVGEIARGDPSTALILGMQYLQQAGVARSARWPLHLQREVALAAVQDGALINALRVEPELGTPARGGLPATRARRDGDRWVLSGRKIFSTGAEILRWGLAWGATDEDEPRIGQFLVPMDAPGVSIVPSWDHLGMRATGSHTVVFDDVRLPLDHGADLRSPADWSEPDPVQAIWGPLLIAALYDGIARAARDWLFGYLRERSPSNLGAPLATLPRFRELAGGIEALLLANRRLIDAGCDAESLGEGGPVEAGLVKHVVTGNAMWAVEMGVAAIGNAGLSRTNPIERHLRDVLCSRIHSPQDDTILANAGRAALAG